MHGLRRGCSNLLPAGTWGGRPAARPFARAGAARRAPAVFRGPPAHGGNHRAPPGGRGGVTPQTTRRDGGPPRGGRREAHAARREAAPRLERHAGRGVLRPFLALRPCRRRRRPSLPLTALAQLRPRMSESKVQGPKSKVENRTTDFGLWTLEFGLDYGIHAGGNLADRADDGDGTPGHPH